MLDPSLCVLRRSRLSMERRLVARLRPPPPADVGLLEARTTHRVFLEVDATGVSSRSSKVTDLRLVRALAEVEAVLELVAAEGRSTSAVLRLDLGEVAVVEVEVVEVVI